MAQNHYRNLIIRLVLLSILVVPGLGFSKSLQVVVVGLFNGKAVVMINGQQHLMSADNPRVGAVRFIDANSQFATLEVNGTRQRYTADGFVGSTDGPSDAITMQLYPDRQGMYETDGFINDVPTAFLVDTGATLVAINSKLATQLGIAYKVDGEVARAATASGNVKTYLVTLKKITLGGITVHNVKAAVIEGTHPQKVLLGMSFLSRIKFHNRGRALMLIQE